MTLSMYDASVGTVTRALNNLVNVLEKGSAHADARKIDPAVLVGSRLYPDMFPLAKQVQVACDIAKIGSARLAGAECPKNEDTETTFADLIERVRQTIAFLGTLKREQLEGADERTVTFPAQGRTISMAGREFLFHRMLPNVFFHVTTAYNILRHNGVELGKQDYLGPQG